jgi:tetratricopeptide (TPR) repeat protein
MATAEALEHAHSLGVVHRDVKPGNLMIDAQGKLWVTDFGLARFGADAGLTLTGDFVGTLRYMSPEQALAKHGLVDHRTDVYALGATLYELLTRVPAVGGQDRQEILRKIAFDEPAAPRSLNRAIPADLETVVRKALAKEPSERYATAREMADDLRCWLEDKPIQARRPTLLHRLGRWRRRHKPLVRSVAALVLLVLLVGGGVLGWQQRQRAATEQAVGDDLREADLLQQQERWSQELQVLERASGRLAAGGSPQLRERVEQRRKDVTMVAQLEEARCQRSAAGPEGFDYTGADRAYAAAFANYGLNLEALAPAEAADRIRTSPIRTQLVAALDDWGTVVKQRHAGSNEPARVVARLADDDPWRQQLRDPEVRKDRAALERLAEAEGVLDQPPADLIWLSRAMDAMNGRVAAERLLRRAQQRHPSDFWINFELGGCLYEDPATSAEAIGFLRVALALRPNSHVAYNNLGVALQSQKKLAEAEAAFRKAIELKPDAAEIYTNFGNALKEQNKLAEAEAAFRRAIELDPNSAGNHYSLGNALGRQKKLAEAEAAFRRAIELKPDYAAAYLNLGVALKDQNKLAEAEAAYRKAIEVKPNYPDAHYNLGVALQRQGQLAEAVAAYRKVIELKPDYPEGHCNLGQVLVSQGLFAEALVHRRRGHELGSRDPRWPYPSEQWVKQCERLVELDAKLPQVLKGEVEPADVAERLGLAELCQLPCKSLYAAAARFYAGAFAEQPKVADDLQAQHRYNASCAATLAGCGQGKDADQSDDKERARLRRQALEWLRADLAAYRRLLEKEPDKAFPLIVQRMQHCLADIDFAGVRGSQALAGLPEAERQAWQHLWADVADTLARAQGKTAPDNKPDPK